MSSAHNQLMVDADQGGHCHSPTKLWVKVANKVFKQGKSTQKYNGSTLQRSQPKYYFPGMIFTGAGCHDMSGSPTHLPLEVGLGNEPLNKWDST